ncbi:hypothetical protein [Pseudomonas sp. D3-10]|uniref:hypothetical protein n=1 Tax=Pseudomonas sp. D3-10 TaxID=2817392 RepID=UPI003DA7BB9E
MNRRVLALIALFMSATAQAVTPVTGPVLLAQNVPGYNNPYNSPIRRANPNSMQGTQPNVPTIRSNPTVPVPRPPTLENGGIGNGYPRAGSPAGSPRPTIESPTPPRNTNNGNR